jgi:hypothetical protein
MAFLQLDSNCLHDFPPVLILHLVEWELPNRINLYSKSMHVTAKLLTTF